MIQAQHVGIIMIGIAAVLMLVIAPTLENHQAIAVNQPTIKNVSLKHSRGEPCKCCPHCGGPIKR